MKPKVDSKRYIKLLLEEIFRYLYLLADSSSDGVIRSSPSYFVDQAFHCLMLDPVLYFNICDEMLNLLGKDADTVKMRVLPHDALGGTGDDEGHRRTRYTNTLVQYKATFGEDPPLAIWSDYSNDPVAVQAELEAQEAQMTASVNPDQVTTPATPLNSEIVQPSTDASAPPKPVQIQKSGVKLRFNGTTGNGLGMSVKWSDRFGTVLDRVCTHQQRPTKHVELTYRGMVLRNYMTPYNLNMKDGDVIECNIPIFSPEEIAANKNKSNASTTTAASSVSTTAVATSIASTSATTATTTTIISSTSASISTALATASASTPAATTLINSPTTSGTPAPPAVSTTENATSLGTNHSTSTASLGNNLASTAVPIASNTDTLSLVAMPTPSPPSTDHTNTTAASSTITFLVRDSRDIVPVLSYTMKRTEPMRSVFRDFSNHSGIEEEKLRLLLTRCYSRVNDFDTPKMLEMNDGEELLVLYQQLGC